MELIGKTQEENTDPHTSPPSKTDHSDRRAMSGTIILRDSENGRLLDQLFGPPESTNSNKSRHTHTKEGG